MKVFKDNINVRQNVLNSPKAGNAHVHGNGLQFWSLPGQCSQEGLCKKIEWLIGFRTQMSV